MPRMKELFALVGVFLLTIVIFTGCVEDTSQNSGTQQSDEDIPAPSVPENAVVIVQGFSEGYVDLILTSPGINYPPEGYLASDIRIYVDNTKVVLNSGLYNLSTWKVGQYLVIKADEAGAAYGLFGVGSKYIYDMNPKKYVVIVKIKGSVVSNSTVDLT